MPGTPRAGSYRALFTSGVLTRTFALAMTGRFGYAVLPLVLLFTVSQTSGSFATAATASAVVGLSAFAMPVQARLIDRFSQRRVLPIAAVLTCAALTAMTIAAVLHVASPWTWLRIGGGALSGGRERSPLGAHGRPEAGCEGT